MDVAIRLGHQPPLEIPSEPLTQEAFARFGDVVSNPCPDILPRDFEANAGKAPDNAYSANQGSAIQYRDAGRVRDLLKQAPSGKSQPKMSVFVCQARKLDGKAENEFKVAILERHPFTTQTFTPLASTADRYLVVVAPTSAVTPSTQKLPVPSGEDLPGGGPPNLKELRAFIATGSQAVTYGAGTWHSPMVVLGGEGQSIDFVVTQFQSGEAIEDCQFAHVDGDVRVKVKLEAPRPNRMGKL